jgi:hypothetical protein
MPGEILRPEGTEVLFQFPEAHHTVAGKSHHHDIVPLDLSLSE